MWEKRARGVGKWARFERERRAHLHPTVVHFHAAVGVDLDVCGVPTTTYYAPGMSPPLRGLESTGHLVDALNWAPSPLPGTTDMLQLDLTVTSPGDQIRVITRCPCDQGG